MKKCLKLMTITMVAFVSLGVFKASAEFLGTIQPHSSLPGYVVTYSWKDAFANGMDGGSNGSNAYIDNNTTTVSSNYAMTGGNHAGGFIRYSQHNNDGVNGNFATAPALGANPVHYDGTNGESLTPGAAMRESSHSNIGFVENGGDWYNNPNDYGGVRFFGTGVQGAMSLTSWNGINSSSAYGDEVYDGYTLLGGAMQFGVNGGNAGPGAADSARFGLAFDAAYVNANVLNGLVIGYFPYASTFPNVAPGANLFIDQFNVGTYTSGSDISVVIIDDATYVPLLVTEAVIPEPSSMILLGLFGVSSLWIARRRRK